MDEVDKIIIHSLRDIGTNIDESVTAIVHFTPELIARAAITCLQQIKPDITLPKSLPAGMAQRFAVASQLANECAACGYPSDIGYQSFLYPNTNDVRRLFMYLIEQLPKEQTTNMPSSSKTKLNENEILRREIKEKLAQQLCAAWVPQYCRIVGNRRYTDFAGHSQHIYFSPNLNLNIPENTITELPHDVRNYFQQQAPNVFQQNAHKSCDLVSSVLHKNSNDLYTPELEHLKVSLLKFQTTTVGVAILEQATTTPSPPPTTAAATEETQETPALEQSKNLQLQQQLKMLQLQNENLYAARNSQINDISNLKQRQAELQKLKENLQAEVKFHQRTCIVLEQPQENLGKLLNLVQTAQERRKTLEQQWQAYRQPLQQHFEKLQTSRQAAQHSNNVADLRKLIVQLEQTLYERADLHAKLMDELKSVQLQAAAAAPRKEYTRRIHEFIGNIRKQQQDIINVLNDTRELQKKLNSFQAQLERQYNYTDDLLYQSAKHDVHAKKAYKLLASLHATCNELVELVNQIGQISKEIREFEVQIDRERAKNITVSLAQISSDIQNFRNVIRSLQLEIHKAADESQQTAQQQQQK